MFKNVFKKFFTSKNDKVINSLKKIVQKINSLEKPFKNLTDKTLIQKKEKFQYYLKKRINFKNLIPEVFATVREASNRVFGIRHFDVQILGGLVLNQRCVAEMKTGEGKTLTSTLTIYLNALLEKGVHVVTVNDYLAKRDAETNAPLFNFLGMSVGLNLSGLTNKLKRKAYLSDITYGTNNEFAFDYLKDHMVLKKTEKVQRELYFALIDEIDSILIDEARTPLIISEESKKKSKFYSKINNIINHLKIQEKEDSEKFQGTGDFSIDYIQRQIYLTERGLLKIEKLLLDLKLIKNKESLYLSKNAMFVQNTISALKAHYLFKKNVDYIIKNNEVLIVDEHTGRTMIGKRWSEGIHQAIEAKEQVPIKNESHTLASTTFQNYFNLYVKLAGMTGTASTEAFELKEIYQLDTIVIPTNRPTIRKDLPDLVFINKKEKYKAIIRDIQNRSKKNQPVLVGTISIKKSEIISKKLKKLKIKHNVLNAKFHKEEAKIIAEAGKPGMVTIATNMAGRGTDIILGGSLQYSKKETNNTSKNSRYIQWKKQNKIVLSSGGLHIIGTERHESRRIDNQLRGRAGRQGDVGSSRFYISMEDSLMKIFISKRIVQIMKKIGINEKKPIQHTLISKSIEHAQKKIETRNFSIRRQLLEYDNIANQQRCTIYKQRNKLLEKSNFEKIIFFNVKDIFKKVIEEHFQKKLTNFDKRKVIDLEFYLKKQFNLKLPILKWFQQDKKLNSIILYKRLVKYFKLYYILKKQLIGKNNMNNFEKMTILKNLDFLWKEHLTSMEYLKQGIHLRGYAQKDPKQEYKRESFNMFVFMLQTLKEETVYVMCKMITNLNN